MGAAYALFGRSPPPKSKEKLVSKAKELENKAKNFQGVDSPKSMQEMSGRKSSTGGFRAE